MHKFEAPLLSNFPINDFIKGPRIGQTAVINEVEKVIEGTPKKIIIIEGPVGCGKSAIALTLARAFGNAHLITPRKSLQDQYYEDFNEHVVLMKGRGSYPCTFGESQSNHRKIAIAVREGQVQAPLYGQPNCASGPCKESKEIFKACTRNTGPCPYGLAVEVAQRSPAVIHNLHSFIFQTSFSEKFDKRQLLVIDEAHEIESTVRGFITKKFAVNIPVYDNDRPDMIHDMDSWANFLLEPRFVPEESKGEQQQKLADPEFQTTKDKYLARVENLRAQKDYFKDKFSVQGTVNKVGYKDMSTTFEFAPDSLGNAPRDLLFSFGEYTVLMSGTIYGKDYYCRTLGLDPEEVHYIRISSTIPKEMRPIYLKPQYQVDTSFKEWNNNFNEMIYKMSNIMTIFGDAKGLIHAPSYDAAQQIVQALPGRRAIAHTSQDFQEKLKMFYESEEPLVFVSPVCQQGVDFKQDRARFQIVTRVPYLNTSDAFVNYKVKNDYPWYNYQALIVWGQQLGRINRSDDDYGATFLMDSRFNSFISKNLKVIPKWVQQAFIYK